MIPPAVMRELRLIEIATARRMRTLRVGAYTSRQRGGGFDFDELQPYRPGDEVRRIDWNVTARLDAPYIRHTHAERELNMLIAVDVSRSMDLGTSHLSKREAMMYITASLVFSALAGQVNTGFVAFSDRALFAAPPRRTRAAAWSLLEACWAAGDAAGRTALLPALAQVSRRLRRMTMVFLVSDFLTSEDVFDSPELRLLSAAHDVIAVVPDDPGERALPAGAGYLAVRDLESGRRATIALSDRSRRGYAEQARRRRAALIDGFYRAAIDHVFVPTDGPALEPLQTLFATRLRQ